MLNHRLNLHAIDATPARWRGDAGSSPLDGASTAASSPRNVLVKNCRVHPTHWLISTHRSTEFMRMLGGALVAFCSMLIVMQDWDFPDFSGGEPCENQQCVGCTSTTRPRRAEEPTSHAIEQVSRRWRDAAIQDERAVNLIATQAATSRSRPSTSRPSNCRPAATRCPRSTSRRSGSTTSACSRASPSTGATGI